MQQFVLKSLGKQVAFVEENTRRRTSPRLENIGHHSGVVQVPMLQGNFAFQSNPRRSPASTCFLVLVAVVAKLHHKVNASSAIAIVIVVGLPERAEGVYTDFPIVAEIPA